MPDKSLIVILDEVRGKTLRLLDSVDANHARWAPPGLQNTILWHAGHAYLLLEWLTMKALGRMPQVPNGWYELFSWESRPATLPGNSWPTLAEVIARLEEQYKCMTTIITGLSERALDEPAADHPEVSVRFAILHALHDEACHCGEIHLLRKLQRQLLPPK
jgi:DinB superfamily